MQVSGLIDLWRTTRLCIGSNDIQYLYNELPGNGQLRSYCLVIWSFEDTVLETLTRTY